jgi:Zn-dependent peptidase ImmA (M78 family)
MLRLARQRRRFNQVQAAKLLEINQSLLSRFENGIVEVREDLLSRVCQAYDFPASFFYQRDPVYGLPVSVHPMWRRRADVAGRELDSIVAELNIRIMHLRRLLEAADVINTNDLPQLDIEDYGDPARIAGLLRAHWKVPSGPLRDLTSLAEKAGVLVVHSPLEGSAISGVTFAVPGMAPMVVLNNGQSSDRMRFTLAHELGHLAMHRFPTPQMEEEANEFAVALLMPEPDIRPYFVGRKIDLARLAAMKLEWKVSIAALLMRAHRLKYLSDNQYTYLWKQLSARGYRLREPPELDFEPEVPMVLNQLLSLHIGSLSYSISELAKLLCVHEPELKILYGLGDDGGSHRARLTVLR